MTGWRLNICLGQVAAMCQSMGLTGDQTEKILEKIEDAFSGACVTSLTKAPEGHPEKHNIISGCPTNKEDVC